VEDAEVVRFGDIHPGGQVELVAPVEEHQVIIQQQVQVMVPEQQDKDLEEEMPVVPIIRVAEAEQEGKVLTEVGFQMEVPDIYVQLPEQHYIGLPEEAEPVIAVMAEMEVLAVAVAVHHGELQQVMEEQEV
jgi:hypothetical protein